MASQKGVAKKSEKPLLGQGLWVRYQPIIILVFVGFLAGILWFTAMRFFLVQSPETHYHANFAVYIDSKREEFKDFTYFEEVAACTSAYESNPKGRVHMHGQINDVIHVHDKRVTYGNFFQNLGWNVGDEYIASRESMYQTTEDKKVVYILNGEEVESIGNRVIGNLDQLLVAYGSINTDFDAQFKTVNNTAEEVNKYQDPASCGGLNGAGHDSFKSRLKRSMFWQ
jgi:hypothetical protein